MRQTRPASNHAVVSRIGTPPGAFDLTIYIYTIVGSHDVPFQFHMLLTVSCKKTRYGIVASDEKQYRFNLNCTSDDPPILPTNHPSLTAGFMSHMRIMVLTYAHQHLPEHPKSPFVL